MVTFTEYIQPLIEWLRVNPHWSLFITFFISMLESIAIIGSIVPGSVTMTAVGILAGTGVMRIDHTLIIATIGAMLGDNISYFIGYYYRDNLREIWPFRRYPRWLDYGGDFFKKHGGKSVFIGRFVGPLRSLIPVIAGMMHMKQWRFFIANFFSAILWSIGHIMPGVLIGAAGHQLSTEAATRLFIIILFALIIIWAMSLFVKWSIIRLNSFLRTHLHELWAVLKKHPTLFNFFKGITPQDEKNHYQTAALLLLTAFCLLGCVLLILISAQGEWIKSINTPIQGLMESTRTSALDFFFISCTQLTSYATILSCFVFCCIGLIIHKHYKSLNYLFSLLFFSFIVPQLLSHSISVSRPPGLFFTLTGSAFPNINLTIATSFYSIMVFYIYNKQVVLTKPLRAFIIIVLGLSGLGSLYLGDYWFSDTIAAYVIGLSIGLIHWIVFRKNNLPSIKTEQPILLICFIFLLMLASTAISTTWNYKKLVHNHSLFNKEYILHHEQWWNQKVPLLPIYKYNRLGTIIGLFNVEYSGDIDFLQQQLEDKGWKTHTDSFFSDLLKRVDNQDNAMKLPLLSQLYQNKKPELVMTFKNASNQLVFILRMWESNYYIEYDDSSIWIGSVEVNNYNKAKDLSQEPQELNPLSYLLPAMNQFKIRRLMVPIHQIKKGKYPIEPMIFLIKSKGTKNYR